MEFVLPWTSFDVVSNSGVRQGSVESPGLFSRLVDSILVEVEQVPTGFLLPEIGCDSMAFMDDILAFKGSMSSMQDFVCRLLPRLSAAGLQLQPEKCQLICVGEVGGAFLDLDGTRLFQQDLTILNIPVGTHIGDADVLGSAIEKARRKFQATREILLSGAPLRARLAILDKVVWGSLRWMAGCLCPAPRLQHLLNTFQLECIKTVMKQRWKGEGLFTAFDIQCRRNARYILHRLRGLRWGDDMIQMYWNYLGRRTRNGYHHTPAISGLLSHFRGLSWWTRQQGLGSGERHRGRFFPVLMTQERQVARACNTDQKRACAVDRMNWKRCGDRFAARLRVPWASGRQPALLS